MSPPPVTPPASNSGGLQGGGYVPPTFEGQRPVPPSRSGGAITVSPDRRPNPDRPSERPGERRGVGPGLERNGEAYRQAPSPQPSEGGRIGNAPGAGDGQPGRPQRQGIGPAGAAAIGAAAGLVGGFIASGGARELGEVRGERRESVEGGTRYIREPGRTIEQRDDRIFIRHDENERFRDLGYDVRSERRGDTNVTIYDRPNGEKIVTVTDDSGHLIRRVRRSGDGREVVIIDNGRPDPRTRFRGCLRPAAASDPYSA